MAKLVATVAPPNGKGILVANTDITLDHLELSGAVVPDGNGAGIRYQGGALTITNSFIHDNQDGLLANPVPGGTITIRNSEFAHNGSGDGQTHNIYVGDIASLTIEGSTIRDAVVGHGVKSRAEATTITGSVIDDSSSSYAIDLPVGGHVVLSDLTLHQGGGSQNPAIVHYGGEGAAYPGSSLEISHVAVVNDLVSPSATLLLNQTDVFASIHDIGLSGAAVVQFAIGLASIVAGAPQLPAVPDTVLPDLPAPVDAPSQVPVDPGTSAPTTENAGTPAPTTDATAPPGQTTDPTGTPAQPPVDQGTNGQANHDASAPSPGAIDTSAPPPNTGEVVAQEPNAPAAPSQAPETHDDTGGASAQPPAQADTTAPVADNTTPTTPAPETGADSSVPHAPTMPDAPAPTPNTPDVASNTPSSSGGQNEAPADTHDVVAAQTDSHDVIVAGDDAAAFAAQMAEHGWILVTDGTGAGEAPPPFMLQPNEAPFDGSHADYNLFG